MPWRLLELLLFALVLAMAAYGLSGSSGLAFPSRRPRRSRQRPKPRKRGCPERKPKLSGTLEREFHQPLPLDGPVYAILAIFAGRGDRMRLLLAYADRLLQTGALQEVHLWRNTVGRDALWLGEMAKKRRYSLFEMRGGWRSVYRHYARFNVSNVSSSRLVVVKADDDIVWLDLARFREFVEYASRRKDMLLVHANVVSHGITAYYQFQRPPLNGTELAKRLTASYPPLGGYGAFFERNGSVPLSYKVHELFLNSPEAFSWRDAVGCVAYGPPGSCTQMRFSINFFAGRRVAWKVLAALMRRDPDDERMATVEASKLGFRECFFTPFNAVHLSYFMQNMNLQHLPSYKRLAQAQNLTLPPHPAPWCEDGFQHSDVSSPSIFVGTGNFTARACLALCEEHGDCAGVVFISQGCQLSMDECHLKQEIFPLALRSTACHCVLPKGARTVG